MLLNSLEEAIDKRIGAHAIKALQEIVREQHVPRSAFKNPDRRLSRPGDAALQMDGGFYPVSTDGWVKVVKMRS